MGQKAEAVRAVLRPSGGPPRCIWFAKTRTSAGPVGTPRKHHTPSADRHARGNGHRIAGAERSTRRRTLSSFTHLDVDSTRVPSRSAIELDARARAVSRRAADAVADLRSEPLTYELTVGSRVGSERCSTTSPATDPRRHAGRPGQHSSPMKRPEVASQRRAGIAGRLECFTSPSDHAGHPVKAGPGVWAASQGSVRGDYQAATGGPWA